MERLDLRIERGIFVIRSESDTVYLVDIRSLPRVMRLTGPRTHSRGWWDDQWAPLVKVFSSPDGETTEAGIIRVGRRATYVADPGGMADPNEHWWASRVVSSIEQLTDEELSELLAERGVQ
ncbi:hypothetical protein [Georgenia subflava]|uniref:Uncharacterized protein n=1 Tax=Georgenia subflava TaxID=1622177 RepID=A0A6N7EKH8_9MICO|nr:hypothetical protein [Georgenia subflava]MPV36706.1 hypothetical protein [Georgenia subflava]